MESDLGCSESLLHQAGLDTTTGLVNLNSRRPIRSGDSTIILADPTSTTNYTQRIAGSRGPYSRHNGKIPQMRTEQSPLLGQSGHPDPYSSPSIFEDQVDLSWQQESRIIITYSVPLIVTFLLQYSITVTSVFVAGRLGAIELGAVSLGNMSAAITCLTPFQGLATSLDTLCAQAFGSGNNHLVGIYCQRLTLFLFCLSIPVAMLWMFSEQVFLLLVPDPRTAELAGVYLRILAFGIPGIVFFETGKRFLSAQCLFRATTYLLLIAAPINILLHWFLVWKMEMGFVGAPIAAALTTNLIPVLLLLYIMLIDGSKCWGGFSRRAFSNWGSMLSLALPAMFMVEAEWLVFELMTFLASRFGTDYLAAQSILSTLTSISYQVPFPLSIAASTRVAHLIGAGEVTAARKTAKVAFGATLAVVLANLIIYAIFRYQLPTLFTKDQTVIALTAANLPLVAIVQVFDGISSGAHGLLRGIGKQYIGGPVNLVAYYIIALPIVLGLVFGLDWKLDGMWLGVGIGLICVALFEYTYLVKADWNKAADEAKVRNAAA